MSKIIAIDFGKENIGLAISDPETNIAFPFRTLKNKPEVYQQIKDICEAENVIQLVVGLPINLSGQKTKTTEVVFDFIEKLKKNLGIQIKTIDERWSTAEALKKKPKKAKNIDELSAQTILQSYLDK